MKSCSLLIAAMMLPSVSMAAPKFAEADQWRRELRQVIDANMASMNFQQRAPTNQKLDRLKLRAEKMFRGAGGDFESCISAADMYTSAYLSQLTNTTRTTDQSLSGQTRMAFEAGSHYWACRLAIDGLEVSK